MELSRRFNRLVRFKGTVMAGTPSFNIIDLLPGIKVNYFMGILNGTTNYILTRMYEGMNFNEALRLAQERGGYAEADPSLDIDGWDAALKAIIISRVLGWRHSLEGMEVRGGIRDIDIRAYGGDRVVKLIAYANAETAYVKPVPLSRSDVLAHVNENLNALRINTDILGDVMVIGPGAGPMETAQAVLTDLMYIINHLGGD